MTRSVGLRTRLRVPAFAAGAAVLAAALACTVPGWAGAAPPPACARQPPGPVGVTLSVDYGHVTFNHQLGQLQIHRLYLQDGMPSPGVHGMAVGLTRIVANVEFQTRVVTVPSGDGRYCAWLTGVDARLRYADTNVYVDRRYPEGSCEFHSIADHERQHVVINRATLDRFAPRVRTELEAAVRRINPIVVDRIEQARDFPGTLLQQELDPVLRAFNQERERVNAKIDTPENYRRTLTRCTDW
ncbi:MAG: hypothetical protein ABT940_09995 [Alphaproteobacteria bacterium]